MIEFQALGFSVKLFASESQLKEYFQALPNKVEIKFKLNAFYNYRSNELCFSLDNISSPLIVHEAAHAAIRKTATDDIVDEEKFCRLISDLFYEIVSELQVRNIKI